MRRVLCFYATAACEKDETDATTNGRERDSGTVGGLGAGRAAAAARAAW